MEYITPSYLRPKGKGIRLHLGCGDYWREGSLNIDFNVYGGTDMLLDIRKPLPFQDHVVELIEAYEVLEHMNKYEMDSILKDWKRLLITQGHVKVCVPDMDGLVAMYGVDKKKAVDQMYGLEDHPHHKQGFTKESLEKVFLDHGFEVKVEQGELPERPGEPKLLVEAWVTV